MKSATLSNEIFQNLPGSAISKKKKKMLNILCVFSFTIKWTEVIFSSTNGNYVKYVKFTGIVLRNCIRN